MSNTVSVPQRAGTLSDPLLYETISRMISAINLALTIPMASSVPTSPSGTLSLTKPTCRLVGAGTIKTISADFGVPVYLFASSGDVSLETGGNIAASAIVRSGTACALVLDATSGLWWPISGSGGVVPDSEESMTIPASYILPPASGTTRILVTAGGTVKGVSGGVGGRSIELVNSISGVSNSFDILSEDTSVSAALRIITPNLNTVRLHPGDVVRLTYSAAASRWRVVASTSSVTGTEVRLLDAATLSAANATVTFRAGYNGISLSPDAAGRSVDIMQKSPATYVAGEIVFVENGDSTNSFDINHLAGAGGFGMPSGAALTLAPRGIAMFIREGSYWRHITPA